MRFIMITVINMCACVGVFWGLGKNNTRTPHPFITAPGSDELWLAAGTALFHVYAVGKPTNSRFPRCFLTLAAHLSEIKKLVMILGNDIWNSHIHRYKSQALWSQLGLINQRKPILSLFRASGGSMIFLWKGGGG